MHARSRLLAIAGLLALASLATAATRDHESTTAAIAPPGLSPPPALATLPDPADSTDRRLVRFVVAPADTGVPPGFARLIVGFTRDSLHRQPELLAVIYLPDTVARARMRALTVAVGRALLGPIEDPSALTAPSSPLARPPLHSTS